MEAKYNEIYEQLKLETQDTLENKNSDKFIEEFKQIVKDRLSLIHKKLDEKKEQLIKLAIDAYEKEISDKSNPEEEEIKKKILKNRKDDKKEVIDPESFKGKVKSLIDNLDTVLEKTKAMEETVNVFKTSKLNALVEIKDDDFYFKHQRKLEYILKGKVYWDLGWSDSMNKPTNSDVDKTDPKQLNVHSNSCYNYFTTDKPISEENVLVTLETNIIKTDGYFYFGVTSDTNNYNGNCMCCTISQCTYMRSSGYIISKSISTTNTNLKYDSGSLITIEIRVLGKDKQVYFRVNDNEEQGPYDLPTSEKYLITSGSCNSANGYIKLVSSLIIG